MAIYEKHFTLTQARRELPGLRTKMARVQELMEEIQQGRQIQMERIRKLVQSNGHGSGHPEIGVQIAELQNIVREITEKGIEIKDLARGLVDFPHWRDEEEVYLCWLYGEDDIRYWHTLEGGFGGRTPL